MSYGSWQLSARILSGVHAGRYLVQEWLGYTATNIYTVVPGQLPSYVTTATIFGHFPGTYDVEPDQIT